MLLSVGVQGVVLDVSGGAASGTTGLSASTLENRMEWAGPPVSVHRLTPFLLTLLSDAVEVHDEVRLA